MEQYQRDQQQLQQYYQQQRIMELQMAQQRQREMEFQNVTRFSQMRDRALAAVAPMGGFVPGEMGLGRNIGLANSAGVARQSTFGALVDANIGGGGLFFRTAGFQLNMSEAAVRDRARQQLDVMQGQFFNVGADMASPLFLQRALGRVGLGNVQERSMGILDTFAGLRGAGANPVTGRGLGGRQAAAITEQLTRRLNTSFSGMLDAEQIDTLTQAASASLDSRDIARAGAGGTNAVVDLLQKTVNELVGIQRNTGMSSNQMTQLIAETRAAGGSIGDLSAMSNVVARNGTTTQLSRQQQMQIGTQFTIQGRQLGFANAQSFGAAQLQNVLDLSGGFQAGTISRAELFRFGGATAEDAAQRIVARRIQAGQQFAQQQTSTLGVLGAGGMDSLRGGMMNFMGDVANRFSADPFAAITASANLGTQQRLVEQSGEAALQMAENEVALMGNLNAEQREALIARRFGELTGRSTIDAVRELGTLRGQNQAVDVAVDNFNPAGRMGGRAIDKGALRQRLRQGQSTFRAAGLGLGDFLSDDFLNMALANPNADANELVRMSVMSPKSREAREERLMALINDDEMLEKLGIDEPLLDVNKGRLRRNVSEAFSGSRLFDTLSRGDVLTDRMLDQIMAQDMTDGRKDFQSRSQLKELLKTAGGQEQVANSMDERGRRYIAQIGMDMITKDQTVANLKAAELGSSPQKPMFVQQVPPSGF